MKKNKIKFDFTAFGQAIKAARKAWGYSRNKLADEKIMKAYYVAEKRARQMRNSA